MAKRAAAGVAHQQQPMQPQWGAIGPISFRWKDLALPTHSAADRENIEEQLTKYFREIKLVGDFQICARGKIQASSGTAGLTIGTVKDNKVLIAYQPGGNDSRFEYAIPLSQRIALDV
jgi:hypothetical protein